MPKSKTDRSGKVKVAPFPSPSIERVDVSQEPVSQLKPQDGPPTSVVAAQRPCPQPLHMSGNKINTTRTVDIPPYDGTESFTVWLRRAKFYLREISEADRPWTLLKALAPRQLDKALDAGINADLPFDALCQRLANLFSQTYSFGDAMEQLQQRRLKQDEALNQLVEDLERLTTVAFPSLGSADKDNTKCQCLREKVNYLGHEDSPSGIKVSAEKAGAILTWPTPNSTTDVRSFIGLASYYRRFIRDFAGIARPLHRLTEKGREFRWTDECQAAFDELRTRLSRAPILMLPNTTETAPPFVLDTDASAFAMGGVRSQTNDNGLERVICLASKTLTKPQRNYCTYRRELLAIVTFVKQFRPYLLGRQFRLPADSRFPQPAANEYAPDSYVWQLQDLLRSTYTLARNHLAADAERQKTYFDRQAHGITYQLGDVVWRFRSVPPLGTAAKFFHPWDGPFVVVDVMHPTTYVLRDASRPDGPIFTTHFDKLKPYRGRLPTATADVTPIIPPHLVPTPVVEETVDMTQPDSPAGRAPSEEGGEDIEREQGNAQNPVDIVPPEPPP
nr:unnamed protein product [Spirometra erinaceieuropaei]